MSIGAATRPSMSPMLEARRTTPMARAVRLAGSALLAAGAITVALAGLEMLREPLAELGLSRRTRRASRDHEHASRIEPERHIRQMLGGPQKQTARRNEHD